MPTDRRLPGNLHQQPRRDSHRDEEREQHGGRCVCGNRRHVRAHEPRDEHHGQEGRNNGQCGNNGRISYFRYRIDGGLSAWATVLHRPMPGDIFDHDDRIINQNADREDQRKQADSIDRVSHHQCRKQGQQDCGRDDNQGHQGFTPTNGKRDQHHNRNGRQPQMEEQLIRLVVCRFAIIAGHSNMDPFRYHFTLQ